MIIFQLMQKVSVSKILKTDIILLRLKEKHPMILVQAFVRVSV